MNKKWIIISIVILAVLIFAGVKILNQPEEFNVEDVMFDRSGDLMN